jgi:hypothetical protein
MLQTILSRLAAVKVLFQIPCATSPSLSTQMLAGRNSEISSQTPDSLCGSLRKSIHRGDRRNQVRTEDIDTYSICLLLFIHLVFD